MVAPSLSFSVSELAFGGTAALTPDGPGDFVARSLELLRVEQPDAFARMCDALAGRHVRLSLAEDVLDLHFSPADVQVRPRRSVPVAAGTSIEAASVEVATDRATIVALVDGSHSLMSAVMADALILRAGTDALLAFHDGLAFYLHGAVRAPGFPSLLAAFRAVRPTTPIFRFGSPS
jgi:hypothetical protein